MILACDFISATLLATTGPGALGAIPPVEPAFWRLLVILGWSAGVLAALAIAVALWSRTLRKRVEQRTLALQREHAARETAEEQSRRLADELGQSHRVESVGHLCAAAAHDFNNVLMAISGAAENLASMPPGPERDRALAAISTAAARGSDLTKRMLGLSKRRPIKARTVSPQAVVRDLLPLIERLAGGSITVTPRLDARTPSILVDPVALQHAIINLAANARDAMPTGGALTITVGPHAAASTRAHISVTDTGVGMDEQTAKHCLEPFFTTKATGTGMGLASVATFVRDSAGSIQIDSALGRGTTINLIFPAAESLPAGLPGPRRRVLLVDHHELAREVVSHALAREGLDVDSAANASDALAMLDRAPTPPALVLTEHALPDMTGMELIARIRERHADLPTLMMTATLHGPPDDATSDTHRALHAHGAISKLEPVSEIVRRVREKLGAL